MKYFSAHGFSTSLLVLLYGGSILWFFPYVLRDIVGYHPALIDFGLIMMSLAMVGIGLLRFGHGKGKQHLVLAVLAVAMVLLSSLLFLRSFGV